MPDGGDDECPIGLGDHARVGQRAEQLCGRVPVGGGEEQQIAPLVYDWGDLSVTAKGAYFLPDQKTLQLFDEKTHRITTVVHLGEHSIPFMGITVSSDDTYLMFCDGDRRRDLMLVEGFR